MKKQFAILLMMFVGFLALSGYFINNTYLREFTDKDATQWYMIIAGFAALKNLPTSLLHLLIFSNITCSVSLFFITSSSFIHIE